MQASANRTKQEEKTRIQNLAAAEGDATDEAEEIAAELESDRDTGFGNMFASLLRGAAGGGAAGRSSNFGRGLKGMRRAIGRPRRRA
jgi:hypothetical protein